MFVEVKTDSGTYFLNTGEIISVQKGNESCTIKMTNGDSYRTDSTYLEVKKFIKEALNRG